MTGTPVDQAAPENETELQAAEFTEVDAVTAEAPEEAEPVNAEAEGGETAIVESDLAEVSEPAAEIVEVQAEEMPAEAAEQAEPEILASQSDEATDEAAPEPETAEPAPTVEAAAPAVDPAVAFEPSPVEAMPAVPVAGVAAPVAAAPIRPIKRIRLRLLLAPVRIDIEGISTTLANYLHNESAAALSHLHALGSAKSPADIIRLQVTEMQRAAEASLTCWNDLAVKATRPLHDR